MEKLKSLIGESESANDLWNTYVKECAAKAVKDKLTTYFKKLIDEDQYDDLPQSELVIDILKELKQKTDNILDTKNGKMNWCFFTINFKDNISHEEIINVMNQFVEKCSYISSYMWSIEQRSEDPSEHYGYHIHILFSKNGNSPSKIQRAFKTKFFDKFVGNPQCLDYKYVENPEKRIKYILGLKDDKEKVAKTEVDEIFRELYGYQRYYCQGDELQQMVEKIKNDF